MSARLDREELNREVGWLTIPELPLPTMLPKRRTCRAVFTRPVGTVSALLPVHPVSEEGVRASIAAGHASLACKVIAVCTATLEYSR